MARRGRCTSRIGLSDLPQGGVRPGSQRSPAVVVWRKCDRVLRQGLVELDPVTRVREQGSTSQLPDSNAISATPPHDPEPVDPPLVDLDPFDLSPRPPPGVGPGTPRDADARRSPIPGACSSTQERESGNQLHPPAEPSLQLLWLAVTPETRSRCGLLSRGRVVVGKPSSAIRVDFDPFELISRPPPGWAPVPPLALERVRSPQLGASVLVQRLCLFARVPSSPNVSPHEVVRPEVRSGSWAQFSAPRTSSPRAASRLARCNGSPGALSSFRPSPAAGPPVDSAGSNSAHTDGNRP